MYLCPVFKAPSIKMKEFNTQLEELLNYNKNHKAYIIGDLNIDLLKINQQKEVRDFCNLMIINSFIPTIVRTTRITTGSSTIIDHIWTNETINYKQNVSGIIMCDISDHLPIFYLDQLNYCDKPHVNNKNSVYKRKLTKKRIERIRTQLSQHNWKEVIECKNTDMAYELFHNQVQSALNCFCPVTKISIKNRE
jgi:hypothetical protein